MAWKYCRTPKDSDLRTSAAAFSSLHEKFVSAAAVVLTEVCEKPAHDSKVKNSYERLFWQIKKDG